MSSGTRPRMLRAVASPEVPGTFVRIARALIDKKASSDAVGLVLAGEKPILLSPLTTDRSKLAHTLDSLHATDAAMAIENARDVYTRRQEGISIWVVESKHITASNPEEAGELYEPAVDKVYRHPSFYHLPDQVKNI